MPTANRKVRLIAATAGTLLIASWALVSFGRYASHRIWYAAASSSEILFDIEQPPPAPAHLVRRAEEFADNVFPPELDRAEEDVRQALLYEPQYSRAWMTLARVRLLENRRPEAREALLHSDALDPVYPRERLESIMLWKMLGEEDRGLRTATRIAKLGGPEAVEAIAELLRNGYSTDEVLGAVFFDRLTTEQRQVVIGVFAKERRETIAGLVRRLSVEDLESPLVRQQLAPLLMRPLEATLLGETWNIDRPGLRLVGGRILVENPNLQQPAFPTAFPMGWLRLARSEAATTWEQRGSSPAIATDGHLRLALPRYMRSEVRWPCYRFIADAGDGFTVTMHLVPSSTRYARVSLVARVGERNINGQHTEVTGTTPFDLSVRIPESDEPNLVTLTIAWDPKTTSTAMKADELIVDGISIVLSGDAPPEDATTEEAAVPPAEEELP